MSTAASLKNTRAYLRITPFSGPYKEGREALATVFRWPTGWVGEDKMTHDPSKLRVTEQEIPHLSHTGGREEVGGIPADEAGGDSGDGGADDCGR